MSRVLLLAVHHGRARPAPLAAQEPASPPPSIVTSGEAIVRRAPDQAFVTLAVETRARNPRDAQRLNAEAMTAVQQRIAGAGLDKDAIRTTGYTIQQEFDFANGRRTPREYVARNGLEIRLDAVERTGEILDLVVQAGATTVTGVRFDIKDRPAAEREALRLAVVDARARAEALAAGAGRTVDRRAAHRRFAPAAAAADDDADGDARQERGRRRGDHPGRGRAPSRSAPRSP